MKYTFDQFFNYFPNKIKYQLENTIQDAKHHTEGCVKNHMKMVFEYIQNNYNEDIELLLCAMFHDLGKIDTTLVYEKKEGIRIHSIEHENYAKEYIKKYFNCFASITELCVIDLNKVMYICKNHMRAHMYYNKRISKPNKRKAMEEHEYFKDLMKFERADELGSIHGNTQRFIIITFGIPGSGKTTWRRKFIEQHIDQNWKVICPDDIRKEVTGNISNILQDKTVWKIAYNRLEEYFKIPDCNIIFDSTACNVKTQKRIESICNSYKVSIIYKIFDIDAQKAKDRIQNDINNNVDRSHVPNEVIDRMYNNFSIAYNRIIQEYENRNVWILQEY